MVRGRVVEPGGFSPDPTSEKKMDPNPTFKKKKTRILIRIPPSRKTSRIQILPNVVRIKFKLLCSFAIKVDIIDILIQYSIFDQCILQELVDFRARFLILMFSPDPTLFWNRIRIRNPGQSYISVRLQRDLYLSVCKHGFSMRWLHGKACAPVNRPASPIV